MKYEVEIKEQKRVEMDLQRLRGFRGRRIRVSIKSSSVSLSNKDCEVDSSDLWFLIGEMAGSVIVPPPENHREVNLLWEICRMGFRFKICRKRIFLGVFASFYFNLGRGVWGGGLGVCWGKTPKAPPRGLEFGCGFGAWPHWRGFEAGRGAD
ncbi:hypothetical protein Hanom_Chr04g00351201 [Helianthus anomalus]